MLFLQVPQWRDGDLWISDPCILLDPKQNLRNLILKVLFIPRPTILDLQASLLPVLSIITLNHLKSGYRDVKRRGDVYYEFMHS